MIKTFRDKETEKLVAGERSRKLPPDIQRNVKKRLDRIHAASRLEDLRLPPSHHLEALHGDRRGKQHPHQRSMADMLCLERGRCLHGEIVDCHE